MSSGVIIEENISKLKQLLGIDDPFKIREIDPEDEGISPMQYENTLINKSPVHWKKIFLQIFSEILEIESGFVQAKTDYTNGLLNMGSNESPQALYDKVDMMSTRLEQIYLIKRLCGILGLHNEMDSIIEHELSLIYKSNPNPPKQNLGGTIVGESK